MTTADAEKIYREIVERYGRQALVSYRVCRDANGTSNSFEIRIQGRIESIESGVKEQAWPAQKK